VDTVIPDDIGPGDIVKFWHPKRGGFRMGTVVRRLRKPVGGLRVRCAVAEHKRGALIVIQAADVRVVYRETPAEEPTP
jgi:hypothetical protein